MPGLADLRADFCDPGHEERETLEQGAAAALAGGFTDVALLPSTAPARDSKVGIEYVVNRSKSLPIHLHAYGALSHQREGKEMAELYDMHQAGAVAFTDGNRPVSNSGLLVRSLLYTRIFNGLVMVLPEDVNLSASGRMHEGNTSTLLGLKGIPNLAEELMVHRDLEILKYTGGRLHFSAVASKGSVEMIRKAKKQGLQVTADVATANLLFTDEHLAEYDSNFKVVPPLRSKADQKALWDGVQDGTIDAIVSNHHPQNKENKQVEFEYAQPGMIALQTALSALWDAKPKGMAGEQLVSALTAGPRKVLGLPEQVIREGAIASLTVFDPDTTWNFNNNFSVSDNSPFIGKPMKGKVLAVYSKKHLHTF